MKALILDLSRAHEIKILNTRIASTVTIVSGYRLTVGAGEDPIDAVVRKLQSEELLHTPAIIIPPDEILEKQTFQFPRMPDKEIQKVLPRQIAEYKNTNEVMVFNYMKNGTVEDRQTEKMETAAFFCAREKLFEFINRLESQGIHVAKIVPETQGLKTLVECNTHLLSERSGVVLLDLMAMRISLNIFRNVYWGLERDFPFRMEEEGDFGEEDLSRISTELNRTFQFFKQKNRSYTIEHIFLYGSSPYNEYLRTFINDSFSIPTAEVTADFFKGKVILPAHLKDSKEFLSIFTLSIATAIAVGSKKYLDVFPAEFKEKAKLAPRLLGFSISGAIIACILFGSVFYFENIKKSYVEDIAKIKKSYTPLDQNIRMIEETKKNRANYYKRRFYMDFPIQYAFAASDFVRKLSLIAASPIELSEIEINPGANQSFTFLLNGRIQGNDNVDTQNKFLEFYQAIKEFENVLRVDSSNVNVNPEANDGKTPMNSEIKKKVELYFTINGEVDAQ
ncbi:MAG: hypothetical protein ACM3SY_04570 [Candidatus Omnitrophota bacterium]